MEKCDVLLTYEIKNREIENLCLIRHELERRGYTVKMRMQYETFFRSQSPLEARLVVVPAYYRQRARFYSASHTIKTEKILNMMWEQVFNEKNEKDDRIHAIKPWGRQVSHIAWGPYMRDKLIRDWGVAPDHVFMTGHVGLDFVRDSMKNYYESREQIFSEFHIPENKTVHLFISSLAGADMGLRVMKNASLDSKGEMYIEYGRLCSETRKELLAWFEQILSTHKDDVIIYRPHPEEIGDEVFKQLEEKQKRFLVIRDRSVKQWILVCDRIYSWMSTSIAEIYAAQKNCQILRPVQIPKDMEISYYQDIHTIDSYASFEKAFSEKEYAAVVNKEKLEQRYYIPENAFSYELICDAIEEILREDKYLMDPPVANPLSRFVNLERMKNTVKRIVASSDLLRAYSKSKVLKNNKFGEIIDDIFYVKEKLKKNYVPEEEIDSIMRRIDMATKRDECVSVKRLKEV